MDRFDVALVCLNGHLINSSFLTYQHYNQNHCQKCGAASIYECPACRSPIRGADNEYWNPAHYEVPPYCGYCGKPFPWTADRIEAAIQLAAEHAASAGLSVEDVERDVHAVVQDTPRAVMAATRLGRLLAIAGKDTALAMRDVLIGVISSKASEVLFGPR